MDASVVLRVGAAVLSAATFLGAQRFVLDHPKNPDAPLQPAAAQDVSVRATATPAPSMTTPARPRVTQPPRITLQPGVRATALPGITFTHVS